ncbi:MAG: hypothetical protein ABFS86_07945 [Planctomycetota bacterium]
MNRIAPLLVLLLLPGCFASRTIDDETWDPGLAGQLVVGQSTREDVLKIMGPPKEVVELLDSDAYVYEHAVTKESGLFLLVVNFANDDIQYDRVTVIVDREGIVRGVGERFKADTAEYGLPFGD